MDLNSERIHVNLLQTWFKLAVTTMINLRLHELIAGCYINANLFLNSPQNEEMDNL
jgi:hypothetical protein